jgi:ATP-dependent Clp protease ATP-binding subunit ClpA
LLQTEIGNRLAIELLSGTFLEGDTVTIDVVDETLVLNAA